MHVPDGFIDAPVSVGAGVVAAVAIGAALRGSRRELGDERAAPLAGLVAAFVFAVQMLNFPVASGTSGHLLGGALAAVLVGPWTGALCISVVLLVQLFFADGGLTAYGVNVTCMAVTATLVAWVVFRGVLWLLPKVPASVVPASFVAALVSVPAAALAFTCLYALGGTTEIPLGTLAAAMIGRARPDRDRRGDDHRAGGRQRARRPPRPGLRRPRPGRRPAVRCDRDGGGVMTRTRGLLLVGFLLALVLAGGISYYASGSPDGLERVAEDKGFLDSADDHALADSPVADYAVRGVSDERLAGGLSGIIGVVVTFAVGGLLFFLAVRRRPAARDGTAAVERADAGSAGP